MKTMINKMKLAIFIAAMFLTTSCATVFGGKVSACQRTKPKEGQPSRAIRARALIADIILFTPGVIVDFVTGLFISRVLKHRQKENKRN